MEKDRIEVLSGNMDVEEYEQKKYFKKHEMEKKKKVILICVGVIAWLVLGLLFVTAFDFLGGYVDSDGEYNPFSVYIFTFMTVIGGIYFEYKWNIRKKNKKN
jgi:hypothetical protein